MPLWHDYKKMNIAITGFSGTGKTTISKLLARRLEKKLISTDDEVAKSLKLSQEKIVKKYGWDRLREAETNVVESISELDDYVLDAGCGIILRNENIINLKRNCMLIFLTADQRTVALRLRKNEDKPDFTKKNYIDRIKGILAQCEEKYKRAADYTIDTSSMSPEEVCDLIMHYVQMEIQ